MGDVQKAPKRGHIVNPVHGCTVNIRLRSFFPQGDCFVSAKVRSTVFDEDMVKTSQDGKQHDDVQQNTLYWRGLWHFPMFNCPTRLLAWRLALKMKSKSLSLFGHQVWVGCYMHPKCDDIPL